MTNTTSPADITPHPIPEQIRSAIEVLLTYLWFQEHESFCSNPRSDHIFLSLCLIQGWLGDVESQANRPHPGTQQPATP